MSAFNNGITFTQIESEQLIRAAQVYQVLSSDDRKIFLQRTLNYHTDHSAGGQNTIKSRSTRGPTLQLTEDVSIARNCKESHNYTSIRSPNQCGLGGLVISLECIEDPNSDLIENVEIEANILKLNGCLTDKCSTDGLVINRLGIYDVNKIKGQMRRRSVSAIHVPRTLVEIPRDAFLPLNGHSSWCSWLILRCQWTNCEQHDRNLRRLGHRQSSKWPLSNSSVVRLAGLPLCKSGETALVDGEINLRLWPCDKTNDQLINSLKHVFSVKHRTNGSPHSMSNKVDAVSPSLSAVINWRRKMPKVERNFSSPDLVHFVDNSGKFINTCSVLTKETSPTLKLTRNVNDILFWKNLRQNKSSRNGNSPAILTDGNLHHESVPHFDSDISKNLLYRFNSTKTDNNNRLEFMNNHRERQFDSKDATTSDNVNSSAKIKIIKSRRILTKVSDSSRCPFCNVFAKDLYFLLKHLRNCHERFLFYHKDCNYYGSRHLIDVHINPTFNNANQLLVKVPRLNRQRPKPNNFRRKNLPSRTHPKMLFMYKNSKQSKQYIRTLDEFRHIEYQETKRITFSARKRQYYHSQTCSLLLDDDIDEDSEDEMDPEWLRLIRSKLLDEFTDVNDGEKKIMKLWNLHIMKYK